MLYVTYNAAVSLWLSFLAKCKTFNVLYVDREKYPSLTDFQNYFTVKIKRKFVIILSLKIPPHLKCVATLPCEMSSVLISNNFCTP